MNYESVETSVVDRLSPLAIPTTEVIPIPEKPKDFDKTIKSRRVTVAVNATVTGDVGLANDPVMSTGATVQTEMIKIMIICQARKLRGGGGMYELIAACRLLLVGFSPDNAEKMFMRDFGIAEGQKDGVWTQTLKFEAKSTIVEDTEDRAEAVLFDDETGEPLFPELVRIVAKSEFGEAVVGSIINLITESGDNLITESGDNLITE